MPQTTEQTENDELCCKHKIHRKQLKITEIHVGHISVLLLCIWLKISAKNAGLWLERAENNFDVQNSVQ